MGFFEDLQIEENKQDSLDKLKFEGVKDSLITKHKVDSLKSNRSPITLSVEEGGLSKLTDRAKDAAEIKYYKNLQALRISAQLINNHHISLTNIESAFHDDVESIENDLKSYNLEIEAANALPGESFQSDMGFWGFDEEKTIAGYPAGPRHKAYLNRGAATTEFRQYIESLEDKLASGEEMTDMEIKTMSEYLANEKYREALETYKDWHYETSMPASKTGADFSYSSKTHYDGFSHFLNMRDGEGNFLTPQGFVIGQIANAHAIDTSQYDANNFTGIMWHGYTGGRHGDVRSRLNFDESKAKTYSYSTVQDGTLEDGSPKYIDMPPLQFRTITGFNATLDPSGAMDDIDFGEGGPGTIVLEDQAIPSIITSGYSRDAEPGGERLGYMDVSLISTVHRYARDYVAERERYNQNVNRFLAEYQIPLDSNLAESLQLTTPGFDLNSFKERVTWGALDEAWDANPIKHIND